MTNCLQTRYRMLLVLLVVFLSLPCFALEAPYAVSGATTVNVHEAKYLYDEGAVFVDVRNDEDWAIGHIDGAIHLDFRRDFENLYYTDSVTKNMPIVIYCNGDSCLRSAYASAISVMWGYSQVYYFRGGFFAWMLEDYPLNLQRTAARD